MGRKLALLFSLYFCQGLPGGFLAVALPVILREQGVDLATIGLAGALSAPWVLKLLWAPLVDAYGSARLGRRRTWLLPAQAGMLVTTLAFTTLSPDQDLWTIAILFLVLNTFAATQDIAVDGWAVDMLEPDELGPGNSAQLAGFKIGNLFGGGVLLALSAYIGWRGDFLIMGGLIAAAMVFVVVTPECSAPEGGVRPGVAATMRSLWRSIAAQGPWVWLFFVYAKFGETFGGSMIKPMLVDHGISRATIGLIDGVYGSLATIAGALLAGVLVRTASWLRTLAGFTVAQGLALIAIAFVEVGPERLSAFIGVNLVENFGGGGVGVCIFALAMRSSDRAVGASNFTAAQVTYILGAFLAGPLSGAVADVHGYLPSLVGGGAMAISVALVAPVAARVYERSATLQR